MFNRQHWTESVGPVRSTRRSNALVHDVRNLIAAEHVRLSQLGGPDYTLEVYPQLTKHLDRVAWYGVQIAPQNTRALLRNIKAKIRAASAEELKLIQEAHGDRDTSSQ